MTSSSSRSRVEEAARETGLAKGTPVDLTLDTSLNFDDLMAAYSRIGRSDAVQP